LPILLRPDFDGLQVLAEARRSKDGPQARRLLAVAAIYDGASRTEAARFSGVTLQIVRDWVIEFNARGPGGLIDRMEPFLNGTMAAARRNRNTGHGKMSARSGDLTWRWYARLASASMSSS